MNIATNYINRTLTLCNTSYTATTNAVSIAASTVYHAPSHLTSRVRELCNGLDHKTTICTGALTTATGAITFLYGLFFSSGFISGSITQATALGMILGGAGLMVWGYLGYLAYVKALATAALENRTRMEVAKVQIQTARTQLTEAIANVRTADTGIGNAIDTGKKILDSNHTISKQLDNIASNLTDKTLQGRIDAIHQRTQQIVQKARELRGEIAISRHNLDLQASGMESRHVGILDSHLNKMNGYLNLSNRCYSPSALDILRDGTDLHSDTMNRLHSITQNSKLLIDQATRMSTLFDELLQIQQDTLTLVTELQQRQSTAVEQARAAQAEVNAQADQIKEQALSLQSNKDELARAQSALDQAQVKMEAAQIAADAATQGAYVRDAISVGAATIATLATCGLLPAAAVAVVLGASLHEPTRNYVLSHIPIANRYVNTPTPLTPDPYPVTRVEEPVASSSTRPISTRSASNEDMLRTSSTPHLKRSVSFNGQTNSFNQEDHAHPQGKIHDGRISPDANQHEQ